MDRSTQRIVCSKIQLYPHTGLIFKALRPPNYGYSLQHFKHHFPTESALLNSEQQVTKHYITMTTGTTTNGSKHAVMIYKCIIRQAYTNPRIYTWMACRDDAVLLKALCLNDNHTAWILLPSQPVPWITRKGQSDARTKVTAFLQLPRFIRVCKRGT